jgi:hypothetical protein
VSWAAEGRGWLGGYPPSHSGAQLTEGPLHTAPSTGGGVTMSGTATIERIRQAMSPDPADVSPRVRARLETLLRDPAHIAKLKVSYRGALEGRVRHSGEVFPDPE